VVPAPGGVQVVHVRVGAGPVEVGAAVVAVVVAVALAVAVAVLVALAAALALVALEAAVPVLLGARRALRKEAAAPQA